MVLRLDRFSEFFAFCGVRPSWPTGKLLIVLFMNVFMIVSRFGGGEVRGAAVCFTTPSYGMRARGGSGGRHVPAVRRVT
jgi:hypothetical protein